MNQKLNLLIFFAILDKIIASKDKDIFNMAEQECLLTLYLDTPKPMMLPFRDFAKHNQLASWACTQSLDPVALTGHAFIGLSDETGIEKRFGYTGQDLNPIKMIKGNPGEVCEEDARSPYNEAIVWRISHDQYDKAMAEIQRQKKDPGTYKLFERNCATFATDVLKSAEVPEIPEDKFALSPHGLVMKKRIMQAKRQWEILKFKTKNIIHGLFGEKKVPNKELLDSLRSKPCPISLNTAMKKFKSEDRQVSHEFFRNRGDESKMVMPTLHPFDIMKLTEKMSR